MRSGKRWVQAAVFGLMSSLVVAGPLPPQFTLGRFVPDDAFLFVNKVNNPERAWVAGRWHRVFESLLHSGIDRDLISLAHILTGQENAAEIQGDFEKATALLQAVQWRDLFDRELVFAQRVTTALLGYEYLILARGKPENIETNFAGLVAVFKELAALTDRSMVTQRSERGADVWSLALPSSEGSHSASSIKLFRKAEVVGLVVGSKLAEEVLGLMAGDTKIRSILLSPRFAKAIGQVKAPDDAVVFVDVSLAFEEATRFVRQLSAESPDASDQALRKVEKVFKLCNVIDYTIVSRSTVGRRLRTEEVTRMRPGNMSSPLARALLDRRPFERFDRYVPADAVGFSLDSFVDLQRLYQAAVDFIGDEIVGGEEAIARWNGLLMSVGFDPQRDLFSWLSGEMISVTIPCCVVTPMRDTDSVYMIRVKDTVLASQKVSQAIDFAKKKLIENGQVLIVSPAAVKAEGFRTITYPAVAMFITPVIGVKDDWLFIGTSASAINKCLDVAALRAPSIRTNDRFRREGLIPDGPVRSASFSDKSNIGERWAGFATIAGAVGGMAVASMPDRPQSQQMKRLLRTLMPMMIKLRPVLQMIDFYSSESAVTTFDGVTLREQRVVNYKGSTPSDAPQTVKTPCRIPR